MKIIIFVRHGRSETNTKYILNTDNDKYPLIERGIEQANALAAQFASVKGINAFYTSPILRALQTAEIVGKKINMRPEVDERLRERFYGNLSNIPFPSFDVLRENYKKEVESGYKGGMEPWDPFQKRLLSFVNSVSSGLTVAVTHYDAILTLLGTVDGKFNDYDYTTKLPTGTSTAIDFENKKILWMGQETIPESFH